MHRNSLMISLSFFYNSIKKIIKIQSKLRKSIVILNKYNELSEFSLKNHKEMAFYTQINHRNILKFSGSKTPNVRSNFAGFKEKVSDFSNFLKM